MLVKFDRCHFEYKLEIAPYLPSSLPLFCGGGIGESCRVCSAHTAGIRRAERARWFWARLRYLAPPPLRNRRLVIREGTAGSFFRPLVGRRTPHFVFGVRIIHLRLSEFLRDTQNSAMHPERLEKPSTKK